jgi:hypothetical protein
MDTTDLTSSLASIGIDIGKEVFHIVGFGTHGKIAFRRKINRLALAETFKKLASCVVDMEACLSAHFVSRALPGLGHEASDHSGNLRQAIAEAALRPNLRTVREKTQLDLQAFHGPKAGPGPIYVKQEPQTACRRPETDAAQRSLRDCDDHSESDATNYLASQAQGHLATLTAQPATKPAGLGGGPLLTARAPEAPRRRCEPLGQRTGVGLHPGRQFVHSESRQPLADFRGCVDRSAACRPTMPGLRQFEDQTDPHEISDVMQVVDDHADGQTERHNEDQQESDRHDQNGDATLLRA